MLLYLLDTNIVSSLMLDPRGPCAQRVRELPEDTLCTSEVVRGELHFGIDKKRAVSPERAGELASRFDRVFSKLTVHPIDGSASFRYGQLRAYLEKTGNLIGANDLWIAAHARALRCVVVTDNLKDFTRVPDLAIENWLRT